VGLDGLDDATFAAIDPALTPDVREVLSVRGSIESRDAHGGTASEQVRRQLGVLRDVVARQRADWAGRILQ
jgi:argininosuccinate lyase